MDRGRILQEASLLIQGDRKDTYGSAKKSFNRIAKLWSAYLGAEISPVDAAMMLALLKVSRAQGNPKHQDSYIDLAGYAALAGELANLE